MAEDFVKSYDRLTEKDEKPFKKLFSSMLSPIKTLLESFSPSDEKSFIQCKESAEGTDLVMTWTTSQISQESMDIVVDSEMDDSDRSAHIDLCKTYHVAAIELKDRRNTTVNEWNDKVTTLMSPYCVVWWFKALFPKDSIEFHIVLAGREEVDRKKN